MHSVNEGQKVSFESKMDPKKASLAPSISRRFNERRVDVDAMRRRGDTGFRAIDQLI
jgi:hypothetical protein